MKYVMLALLLAACGSATDNGANTTDVRGNWVYVGTQVSPALNITGTMHVDQQSGSTFTGTIDLSEKDVQGTIRTRTGQLNGRVIGGDAVDFDVFIDASSRRHVARISADSMSGTWAVSSGVSGSFSGKRVR